MKRAELKEFADNEKKLEFIELVLKLAEIALRTGDTLEISTDDRVIKEYVVTIAKAFKEDMLQYISAIRVDYKGVKIFEEGENNDTN